MTPIEIYIVVMITVGAVIGISYAYRVKQQRQAKAAKLALDRENVQKAKDRLNNARLIRLQEKEKIKQWWANSTSTTTETKVVSAQPAVASYNSMRTPNRPMYDGSNDLLTSMIVMDTLTSPRYMASNSIEQNSYSSSTTETKTDTYSAPEPERSSYSSSYSSSDSDSSYSSSSSDSSYSSSSSD
jgi:hypothetical protein